MVTTRKSASKSQPKTADVTSAEDESEGFQNGEQQRTRKRPRNNNLNRKKRGGDDGQCNEAVSPSSVVKTGNRRPRKGRLAMMMTMPVDVFCEIAHHLEPDDLLRMSRTTKALRELLLSKGSKPIWRAAEEAVGLPECPTDLSSPQYASFVFDTFCMHCFDARAHFDMHAITLRVRLCKTCKKSSLVCDKDYFHFAVTIQESASLKELDVLSLLLTGSENKKKINNLTLAKPRPAMKYKPHLQAVLEKYMSYDRDSDEQKRYVTESLTLTRQMHTHICQLDSWLEDLNETKAQENYNARRIRRENIYEKLKELGYVYEDLRDNLDEKGWKWDKLIEQPRALTDRIWDNIRPELEKTIHLRREKKARLCGSRE